MIRKMTINQLKSQQKEYKQALRKLTFGTEEYEEVKKKLQELNDNCLLITTN